MVSEGFHGASKGVSEKFRDVSRRLVISSGSLKECKVLSMDFQGILRRYREEGRFRVISES